MLKSKVTKKVGEVTREAHTHEVLLIYCNGKKSNTCNMFGIVEGFGVPYKFVVPDFEVSKELTRVSIVCYSWVST